MNLCENSRNLVKNSHIFKTLAKNDKPTLYGVARKPKPDLISAYCKSEAAVFGQLVECLAGCAKMLVVTYNNTTSANPRSNTRMNEAQIVRILENVGKTSKYEFDFKAFSSGKTDFAGHKEMIFACEIKL